jgi:Zn-dependent peptidase ImmA (M78 family)
LGDKLAGGPSGRLSPATKANTYRQKLQRSFAAELLCPYKVLSDLLRGDFSQEAIEEAARHFDVSPWTVQTILVNRGDLPREDLETDFDALVSA